MSGMSPNSLSPSKRVHFFNGDSHPHNRRPTVDPAPPPPAPPTTPPAHPPGDAHDDMERWTQVVEKMGEDDELVKETDKALVEETMASLR